MLPLATDVLIVGAGPAGLALGATLASKGRDFMLIDRLDGIQRTSRAAAVHARTLEVLEQLEISAQLVAQGLQMPVFSMRDRDKALLNISFADLPTRYPYVLMLPQDRTEAMLEERLEQLGGRVLRSHEALDMRADADGADVTIRMPDGAQQTVRARYVIGADGYHSLVRERAGIGFQPGTYAESFVLGDVRMDWPSGPTEMQLYLSASGLMLVAPLPSEHYRIVATMAQAPEQPTRADLQALVNQRGPQRSTATIHQVEWSSRFRLHHGIAAHYRAGCVFLVGDAAHVHSPAGGQGMNIGIQDACDLGARLAAVLQGRENDAALDRYEVQRRPVAERVVALTDRLTRIATLNSPLQQELRNLALDMAGHWPALRQKLAMQLAELRD